MTGNIVESTDRRAKDYFHFGITSFGVVVAIVGVVIVSWKTVAFGLVLAAFGLAYFALED